MALEYRRILPEDFAEIMALQNRNLLAHLDLPDQQQGFLLTAFSEEQFKAMDREIAVVVAVDHGKICAYLAASTAHFNQTVPFPATMLNYCAHLHFQGKPLNSYQLVIPNPLCIAKE